MKEAWHPCYKGNTNTFTSLLHGQMSCNGLSITVVHKTTLGQAWVKSSILLRLMGVRAGEHQGCTSHGYFLLTAMSSIAIPIKRSSHIKMIVSLKNPKLIKMFWLKRAGLEPLESIYAALMWYWKCHLSRIKLQINSTSVCISQNCETQVSEMKKRWPLHTSDQCL